MRKLCYLLLLSLFVSCKKSEKANLPPQNLPIANSLNANAHIIDTLSISKVTAKTLTLSKSTMKFTPAVGDIILASPSLVNPTGLIVKVTGISNVGNDLQCTIQPSNLNEAFKSLNIEYTFTEQYDLQAKASANEIKVNSFIKKPSTNASIESTIGVSFPKGYLKGVDLTGKLNLNFVGPTIKYVKKDGASLPDTVSIYAGFNTNGSDIAIAGKAINLEAIKRPVLKLPNIYVVIPVGPVILIIPFTQRILLTTLPLSVSGKMKFDVLPKLNTGLGLSYENQNFKNLSNFSLSTFANPFKRENFDPEMGMDLTLLSIRYEVAPLFAEKSNAYFEVPIKLSAKISTETPNYSLKGSLNVATGIELEFYSGIALSREVSAKLLETIITEGDWDYKIGDRAFGGIIFYLDKTKHHGLVVDSVDLSKGIIWDPNVAPRVEFFNDYKPTKINGGTLKTVGSGSANTDHIIQSIGNGIYAAKICRDYRGGGYKDWYLPSTDELSLLYDQKDNFKINLFTGLNNVFKDGYWSSSEGEISMFNQGSLTVHPASGAYKAMLYSPDGITKYLAPDQKNRLLAVRAIKSF